MKQKKDEKKEISNRLTDLTKKAKRPIFETSSTSFFDFIGFLADFFPQNKLSIEIDRVNISFKEFFGSGEIRSIAIKDIGEVIIDVSSYAAILKIIEKRAGPEAILELKSIPRKDAFKARRILEGLIIADRLGLDLTKLEPEEVAKKAEELGQASEPEI